MGRDNKRIKQEMISKMKLAVQQQQQQQTAAAAAYYAVSPAFAAATAAQSSANPVFYSPLMTPYAFQSRYIYQTNLYLESGESVISSDRFWYKFYLRLVKGLVQGLWQGLVQSGPNWGHIESNWGIVGLSGVAGAGGLLWVKGGQIMVIAGETGVIAGICGVILDLCGKLWDHSRVKLRS